MKLWAPLLITLLACKTEAAREAERAAQRVQARTIDLAHERQELAAQARESAASIRDELADVASTTAEVQQALAEFERKRAARVSNLEGQLGVQAKLPDLIHAMARSVRLTANERVELDEKLQVLRVRIEEARQILDQLPMTPAASWTSRDDEITRALQRIEDAREDAVEIVEDAREDAPTKS